MASSVLGNVSDAGAGMMLIPGLPDEVALMILVRLPRSLHAVFRAVSCAWRDALQPSTVTSLRNSLRIAEMWAFFLFKKPKLEFVLYDPLLQCFSAPWLRHLLESLSSYRLEILAATGSKILLLEMAYKGISPKAIHCFDAESMEWRSDSIPPRDPIPLWLHAYSKRLREFASAVTTDGFVWVVGGLLLSSGYPPHRTWKASRGAARLDVKTMTWETMPKMHERRILPVVFVWQGWLCVIGGHTRINDRLETVPSGEMWDPTSQKWVLEPELWPTRPFVWASNSFIWAGPTARIAVVLDTLYAVMSSNDHDNRESTCYVEIMHYESSLKCWTSLGNVPISEYPCGSCAGSCSATWAIGVGQELWVVLRCFCAPRSKSKILSCVPGAGLPPLFWRTLPFPSGSEYAIIEAGVVHV